MYSKNILLFFTIILLTFNGFSQNTFEKIPIANDIWLIRISENIFVHVSVVEMKNFGKVSSNGMILCNGKEAFLFDTPANDTLTKKLVEWLSDSMGLKINGFVPNHWHKDCMGGLAYLQSRGIASYANIRTINAANLHNLPVPETAFNDTLQLWLGNTEIRCYYPGAAHTYDNIVVWIPAEKILFAGCMVKCLAANSLGYTADGNLNDYQETISKVMKKFPDAKLVIPGHGEFGGRELLNHTLELCTQK